MSNFFGADYYPEHWPRERWETDAKLMRELGLDLVRMGEFAWARFEPRKGEFDFKWMDSAIQLLAEQGVKTVLGTPTAAPPAWIIEETPEILPVNDSGVTLGFGGRHHACQSNAVYRGHAARLVTAMAEHYKDNEHVIGWQIDNELGNSHGNLCMCGSCEKAFQDWLRVKYKTIGRLNEEWGTAFWSQTYDAFHQIPAPKITPNGHNPSLLLDWKRFCSDLIVDFQQRQIDIIRKIAPCQFITHNCMGFADKVNYYDLGKNLDFVSHDQYNLVFWDETLTCPPGSDSVARTSVALDVTRGFKDKPFWIMEQQAGPTGWQTLGHTPRPGQLRLWTAQSVARGADTVVFFRWRTCAFGTEQYWHGVLPHSGVPGRRYAELKKAVAELRPLMAHFCGTKTQSSVGIVYSYDQNWALTIQPHHPQLNYIGQLMKYHLYFHENNIPVDFVSPDADFSSYKLIVAPLQYLMTPELERKIEAYVSKGGHIILTMRTGVKNGNNVCMSHRELPGSLGDLLKIEILDYDCLRGEDVKIGLPDGSTASAGKWCDIITLKGAKALARYESGYYKGEACATSNAFGGGAAYYIGCEPDK
ncbi:MAG: beta-galactosidase, partial [Clostridiales bacterium]|nr:beta-galactosidase [Clostridiales bacterium]